MNTNDLYANIGQRIRRLRKAQKLTQEQLAEASGISLSFLGHIERGTRKLSLETLYAIMQSLNCSANDLLGSSPSIAESRISERLFEIASQLRRQGN